MPMTKKTPDVYVEELSIFPPSVAEVGTAIPAFVGYTKIAKRVADEDLRNKPTKIRSFAQYELYYGGPQVERIDVAVTTGAPGEFTAEVSDLIPVYILWHSVKLYFANGGAECYIVSVGPYKDPPSGAGAIDADKLLAGVALVAPEDEPTMIVVPEAWRLSDSKYGEVVQAVLAQCAQLQDRFGIFDALGGETGPSFDSAAFTRARTPFNANLKYGAVYYPHIRTTYNYTVADDESNVFVKVDGGAAKKLNTFMTDKTLIYNVVKEALTKKYVVVPPSAAVAGVYAATDNARGVWKAPANVALANVIEPVVRIDNKTQEDYNVDTTSGKSINALRAFASKGTLVWGARTLAGNDNEWRYVSVRRFFIMVEESVKKSTYWAVFEPNDANTWVKVRGMIESYLTDKWREGALAGATPKDAFFVRCGLGTTMNAQDILEGRMNVEIGMAAVRPAEFVILKFSHKMQVS
jgi:phage tail sheath protein FI